jgi:hypothetical protein
LTSVTGDYYKSLSSTVRPGQTKYGVTEWGIKKKYAERTTFTYTNTCGDTESLGESGLWNGKIEL